MCETTKNLFQSRSGHVNLLRKFAKLGLDTKLCTYSYSYLKNRNLFVNCYTYKIYVDNLKVIFCGE